MSAIIALIGEYSKSLMENLKFLGIAGAGIVGFFLIKNNDSLKAQNEFLNQELEDEEKARRVQNEIAQVVDAHKNVDTNNIVELMHKNKL